MIMGMITIMMVAPIFTLIKSDRFHYVHVCSCADVLILALVIFSLVDSNLKVVMLIGHNLSSSDVHLNVCWISLPACPVEPMLRLMYESYGLICCHVV